MTTTTAEVSAKPLPGAAAKGRRTLALIIVSKYGTLIAMAIMIAIFAMMVPNGIFLTTNNLLNIVNQSALTAIIASGLTMVLVVGEFDKLGALFARVCGGGEGNLGHVSSQLC